jgi:ribosomal protein S21
MSLEIYVTYDIDRAIATLKKNYKRDFAQDILRHSYFLSPLQRKRIKRLKAIRRRKKAEALQLLPFNRHRRFRDDKGKIGLGSLRD